MEEGNYHPPIPELDEEYPKDAKVTIVITSDGREEVVGQFTRQAAEEFNSFFAACLRHGKEGNEGVIRIRSKFCSEDAFKVLHTLWQQTHKAFGAIIGPNLDISGLCAAAKFLECDFLFPVIVEFFGKILECIPFETLKKWEGQPTDNSWEAWYESYSTLFSIEADQEEEAEALALSLDGKIPSGSFLALECSLSDAWLMEMLKTPTAMLHFCMLGKKHRAKAAALMGRMPFHPKLGQVVGEPIAMHSQASVAMTLSYRLQYTGPPVGVKTAIARRAQHCGVCGYVVTAGWEDDTTESILFVLQGDSERIGEVLKSVEAITQSEPGSWECNTVVGVTYHYEGFTMLKSGVIPPTITKDSSNGSKSSPPRRLKGFPFPCLSAVASSESVSHSHSEDVLDQVKVMLEAAQEETKVMLEAAQEKTKADIQEIKEMLRKQQWNAKEEDEGVVDEGLRKLLQSLNIPDRLLKILKNECIDSLSDLSKLSKEDIQSLKIPDWVAKKLVQYFYPDNGKEEE